MKWRVVTAALFVLLVFAGFAYLYVNAFVRKQQHAIILFVVNGLDLNTLNLARQQPGRSPALADPDDPGIGGARRRAAYRSERLGLDSFWNVALLNLQDPGQPVPDAGANATAIACGRRVQNGYVATANGSEALPSLIYEAQKAKRATGLVTTSSLVQPVPVAFYSSIKGTPDPYRNASELIYSRIDVILGGGAAYFTRANATNERGRTDGQDLLKAAADEGYTVIRTRDELENFDTWLTPKLLGLFADDGFYFASLQPGSHRQPSLTDMTRIAVAGLNKSVNGYFLVVEHDLVARAAEQNFGKLALNEVAEVDEAIQTAVQYAGPDALVVVTNNYSLGAVGPLPEPSPRELVAPTPTVDAEGRPVQPPAIPLAMPPQPRWLSGPGGPTVMKAQAAWVQRRSEQGWFDWRAGSLTQPEGAFRFETRAVPTAEPAWLASRGEGSSQLRGFLNNTDVFEIIDEEF